MFYFLHQEGQLHQRGNYTTVKGRWSYCCFPSPMIPPGGSSFKFQSVPKIKGESAHLLHALTLPTFWAHWAGSGNTWKSWGCGQIVLLSFFHYTRCTFFLPLWSGFQKPHFPLCMPKACNLTMGKKGNMTKMVPCYFALQTTTCFMSPLADGTNRSTVCPSTLPGQY